LIGTIHPYQFDNPPEAGALGICPTNKWGEAQKLLHHLWVRKLLKDFKPDIVFDESHCALVGLGLEHQGFEFLRSTNYVPFDIPWVYMDVPVNPRTVEKLRNALFAEDMGYQFLMREQYWLQTISWIADAMGAQRIAVICGSLHVQRGWLEQQLSAFGTVETHNVLDQHWCNDKWQKNPHDQSIVDGWVEEHAKKNVRLGKTCMYCEAIKRTSYGTTMP